MKFRQQLFTLFTFFFKKCFQVIYCVTKMSTISIIPWAKADLIAMISSSRLELVLTLSIVTILLTEQQTLSRRRGEYSAWNIDKKLKMDFLVVPNTQRSEIFLHKLDAIDSHARNIQATEARKFICRI